MNQKTYLEIQKLKENLKGNDKLFYYFQEEKLECMKRQNLHLQAIVELINELAIKINTIHVHDIVEILNSYGNYLNNLEIHSGKRSERRIGQI